MLLNRIGKIIKEERIKNNLTLETLSELSNISISTLSKMENDKIRNISSVFLYRICKILNLDYEKLLRQRWDLFPVFFDERKHNFASK
jgi:transcriptional regulator with XRE-family HTH domain